MALMPLVQHLTDSVDLDGLVACGLVYLAILSGHVKTNDKISFIGPMIPVSIQT